MGTTIIYKVTFECECDFVLVLTQDTKETTCPRCGKIYRVIIKPIILYRQDASIKPLQEIQLKIGS